MATKTKKPNPFAGKAKAPADSKASAAALVKKVKGKNAGQTAPAAEQAKPAAKRQFPSLAGRVDAAPDKPAANNFAKVLAAAKAKKKKA